MTTTKIKPAPKGTDALLKRRAPGAGRKPGPGKKKDAAAPSNMCASLAEQLMKRHPDKDKQKLAFLAAIEAMKKDTAAGQQRGAFAVLTYETVRQQHARLRASGRWLRVEDDELLMLLAESEFAKTSAISKIVLAEIETERVVQLAHTLVDVLDRVEFSKTNPNPDEVLRWLAARESKAKGKPPR